MRKSFVLSSGAAWRIAAACGVSPLFLAAADVSAQTFGISIAVRETGSTAAIGQPSVPNTGQIEWINLDGLTLTADGSWQQFIFNFGTDTVTSFVGNGLLDGTRGTLEHIRIRNSSGAADPFTFYIDDVVNTVSGTPTVVSGFEQTDPIPAFPGVEHMFQEPGFSGSTASNVVGSGSSLVVDDVFNTGAQSTRVNMQFVDGTPSRWVRLTTAGPLPQQNPTIDFSAGNSLSFFMRAIVAPPAQRWLGPGGGNWSDPANWGTGIVPNSTSAVANFLEDITAPSTINVDVPITVNTVRLKNENALTFDGAPGAGSLTFDGGANVPRGINSEIGNHTFNVPITLNMRDAGTGTFAEMLFGVGRAQDVLTINSDITYVNTSIQSATLTVQKQGPGRLDITNLETDDAVTHPLRVSVQGGTMRFIPGSGRNFLSGVTIAGGVTPTAKLDITNNPLVIDHVADASPINTIRAQIASAYNGGAWDGNGLTSSQADANNLGIGYANAASLSSVPAIFGTVDADALLIRLTRYGDANLDGQVNLADFNSLASNFGLAEGAVWSQGDFNYDGVINLGDFNKLAANFGQSAAGPEVTPQDWANLAAAVPEPASLSLLGLGALSLARRRRHA